jgi:hypothetical protein
LRRRIAIALLHVATWVLPASRREWLRDMRGEFDYVQSESAALEWAAGCLWASFKERAMLNSNGQISRPVLVLEWLMCFVPLTMIWIAGLRYIVHFGATADIVIGTAFGTLGPVALVIALFATLSKSGQSFRRILQVLLGAFALMCVLQLVDAGAKGRLNLAYFRFDWSVFVLLSVLPLAGTVHLSWLSRSLPPSCPSPAVAGEGT